MVPKDAAACQECLKWQATSWGCEASASNAKLPGDSGIEGWDPTMPTGEPRAPRILHTALVVALLWSDGALAQTSRPRPPPSHPRPPVDDVPFVRSRDGDPLQFTISGLTEGWARAGPGLRNFGVCWAGGRAPYAVRLIAPGGRVMVDEVRIQRRELAKMSTAVRFEAGAGYKIELSDATEGPPLIGRFDVLDRPVGPMDGQAAGADLALSYEAYLQVLPQAVADPGSTAQASAQRLCHR